MHCNVTLRRVQEVIVLAEKQNVLHISVCVCVFVCVGPRARACACAHVALIIQHATRRHIVICSLSLPTKVFDIILYKARYAEKKSYLT